jgi:hypothetical protein
MPEQLLNHVIQMIVSEPWDLAGRTIRGRIVAKSDDALLIMVSDPFEYQGARCEYLVANPRYEGGHFQSLADGECVQSGVTKIDAEKARGTNPFDLSAWRGGPVMLADIQLADSLR